MPNDVNKNTVVDVGYVGKSMPNTWSPTSKNNASGLNVNPLNTAKSLTSIPGRAMDWAEATKGSEVRFHHKMAQHGLTAPGLYKNLAVDRDYSFIAPIKTQEKLSAQNADNILVNKDHFYKKSLDIDDMPSLATGTASMMNEYVVFSLAKIASRNGSLFSGDEYLCNLMYDIDTNGKVPVSGFLEAPDNNEGVTKLRGYAAVNPTAKNIIDASRGENNTDAKDATNFDKFPYSFQDFIYCKYYGKVPNNRMITLRRYPIPVYDNAIGTQSEPLVPVAQAITYFGEGTDNKISDVLKFSYGLKWKEVKSEVQEVDGNERGLGSVFAIKGGEKMTAALGAGAAAFRGVNKSGTDANQRWNGQGEKLNEWAKNAYKDNGPYWNQVFGPVNVVDSSTRRDRGMAYEESIKIKFAYSLRSYDGINPKVAMLDIMSNFLTLTYNNAKFWGGCMRYFPDYKAKAEMMGDYEKFYSGDYSGYFKSVKEEVTEWGKTAMNLLGSLKEDPLKTLTQLAGNVAAMALGKLSAESRPGMLSIRTLLSGDPTGEWHLTIGNPLDPIQRIGNLHLYNTEFSCSDVLGADDFPTEVYFTVTIKPGMPRDLGAIESRFNLGYGKMTYRPFINLPSEMNTFGSNSNPDEQKILETRKLFQAQLDKQANTQELAQYYLSNKEARESYIRVQGRINADWGANYSNSRQLVFLMAKTRMRF